MKSFYKFLENKECSDERIMNIVRFGKELRNDKKISFWDDFISMCGNSEDFSKLLGVNKNLISTWPSKIKEALDDIEVRHAEQPDYKIDKKVIATGDNGAFTAS